jgi:translation initiation factor IF-2
VKRGCLRIEDIFVSGLHEGRVRFMMNDRREHIKIAYPGEAVHLVGFKHFPEVGNPLYVVKTIEEAKFIISKKQHRAEIAKEIKISSSADAMIVHDMKKAIGSMSR